MTRALSASEWIETVAAVQQFWGGKHRQLIKTVLVVLATVVAVHQSVGAPGGPLIPPGPPGVIYKTLDEVEPRIPISSVPYTISRCGSFYLTGCLTGIAGANGITINASDVTLDLRGFALVGVGASLDGIRVTGSRTNIAIFNGIVRDWRNDGIDCSSAFNSQLRELRTSNNSFEGMQVGTGGLVVDCTSQSNGQDGIDAGNDCTIRGCTTSANLLSGIAADNACNISDCSASGNTRHGIEVIGSCRVVNNTCDGNGVGASVGAGIQVSGTENRIEDSNVTGNDVGLDINGSANVVANNTVRGNTDNYDFATGNQITILLGQIPESIDWPCSVVLAGNLTGVTARNGLTITTNDVAIDLNGHALVGTAGSLDGISVSGGRTNITIRNGTLRGWGSDGVQASASYNSSFSDLRVSANGANGLQGGNGAVIKGVTARGNRGIGITTSTGCTITDSASSENSLDGIVANSGSTVLGSSAYNNGRTGISASTGSTIVNCTAYSNTNGISASSGSTVTGCTATSNATNGIIAAFGATITGCTARENRTGINVGDDSRIMNNTCDQSSLTAGDVGILVTGSDNRIDGNHVTDNVIGIDVNGTGNLVVRNTAAGNTTAYSIIAGNHFAAVIVGPGVSFASTAPWANFSF